MPTITRVADLVPLPAVNETDRLYTIADASDLLGVSKHYIYNRINDGEIKTVNLSDGKPKLRITATDLTAFINTKREAA